LPLESSVRRSPAPSRARRTTALQPWLLAVRGSPALAAAAALWAVAAPAAEEPARPQRTLTAARRTAEIHIDGKTGEKAWEAAQPQGGFTQVQPDEGAPATVATRVRALFDSESLYFAIECDDPEEPTDLLSRRDRDVQGDQVSVVLDTTLDRRTAYRFTVHSAGQQSDGIHFDDTGYGADWDGAWESAVARREGGWSVEIRLPLRILRLPEGASALGLDVVRVLARRHEESHWQFVPRGVPGVVSKLGALAGLEGIHQERAIDLRPYVAWRGTLFTPELPQRAPIRPGGCTSAGLTKSASSEGCIGLDFKAPLTSGLALLGALNPDFGQVESDQRVLNLTTFETFLPEKRPFFTEGLELFQPPVRMTDWGGSYGGDAFQLFYSRRVGRALAAPALDAGAALLDQAVSRPVASALKLVGQAGPVTTAALSAFEPVVRAAVLDAGGAPSSPKVADAAHSFALRAKAPLGDNAIAGTTFTGRDPLFAPGQRHAHAAALDLTLFDDARDASLALQAAGSHLYGGADAVQPDGTLLSSGATGGALQLRAAKDGGWLTGFVDYDLLSDRFEVNDLGYQRRGNLQRGFAAVAFKDLHPSERWQKAAVTLSGRDIRAPRTGTVLYRDFIVQPEVTFGNFWTLLLAAVWVPARGDDRELLDGTPVLQSGGGAGVVSLATDPNLPLSATLDLFRAHYGKGTTTSVLLTATLRPASRLEAHLELGYDGVRDELRRLRAATTLPARGLTPLEPLAATAQERLYLFAPQSADSFSALLRGTLSLSPRLTLQAYAQLFTAGIAYGSALRAVAPPGRAPIQLEALSPALAQDGAPVGDNHQAGLDVNLILRWEWQLGSVLYLVYAHHAASDLSFAQPAPLSIQDDLRSLGSAPRGDSLLFKIDLLGAL
jgi:Domain of unknown function (DUF5916)/Carbohydrate family 9 binding domain-like